MEIQDQLQRELSFKNTPKRIVSLVPSQTELLVDLGLRDHLIGITKFCVHPESLRNEITVVGGTKKVNLEKIKALKPDIIICNKEENTEEIVLNCSDICSVWVSDIYTIQDCLNMITKLGQLFNVQDKALAINRSIKSASQDFVGFIQDKPTRSVAYLIWKDPYMIAGQNTFINELLQLNNFQNFNCKSNQRYPQIQLEELDKAELILLSSEPYPFKASDVQILKNALNKEVRLVDGEYFSWYGSRLKDAFSYFKTLH